MSGARHSSAALWFWALLCASGSITRGQNAPSKYIVADPVANLQENGQVVGQVGMGQMVSITAIAENGTWGLVNVGGRSGWIESKHLVPARPLSIAYFQGTGKFNLARQAMQQGNKKTGMQHFASAIPLLRKAVDLAKKEGNQRYLSSSSTNLAISYVDSGQLSSAEPHYLQAWRTNEALLGQGHERLGADALNLGYFYDRLKRPKDALAWHQKALGILEARHGRNHTETAKARLEVGGLFYLHLHQLAEAEALLSEAHSVLRAGLGAANPQTLHAAQLLAQVDTDLGKLREAEALYREVLGGREATVGPNDLSLAGTCQLLAGVCRTLEKDPEVESLLRRCLRIRETHLGQEHPHLIITLRDLADLATVNRRDQEAEQHLERAMAITNKTGKKAADVASIQEGYGNLRKQQGRYEQAEEMYRKSLATLEKAEAAGTDIAHTLRGLSMLLMLTERHEAALPVLQRRLRLLETAHGRKALQLVDPLETLSTVHRLKGRLAEAEELQRRALEIVQRHPGSKAYEAAGWNNMGAIFANQKKHEAASEAYRRALSLFEQTVEHKNHRPAYVRINLALQEQLLGHHAEAHQHALQARTVLEQCAGDFVHARSLALGIEADALRALGRMDAALDAAHDARLLDRKQVDKMLLVRSENERLQFLQGPYAETFHRHVSWALSAAQNEKLVAATAEWVINGKNLATELQANVARMSRQAAGDRMSAVLDELEEVRRQMADALWRDAGPAGSQRADAEMARLTAEEARLTHAIRALGTPETVGGRWTDLDTVRRAVPSRACLVEMLRLRLPGGGHAYVAWLIPPVSEGTPAFVNLGDAAPVEKAVARAHREIHEAPERIVKEGEAAAEKHLRVVCGDLARLVLDPLLPHLKNVERCFIAPDAALWLVPWASLPADSDTYLVEKLEICQVATGRELTRPPTISQSGAPLVLADPDFDLSPSAARRSLAALHGGGQPSAAPPRLVATRSVTRNTLPKMERLPGTAAEARAILPALARYAGAEAALLTGDKALEGAFKSASRPRVVMLSTHGFFFPASDTPAATASSMLDFSPAVTGDATQVDNPLLRCGLLLAGCNARGKTPATSGLDDGVLSGLEILGVDLEGCELVVLSACETGLGKAEDGEGVAGLRQAFQLAGARGVMDTLWAIPDEETTRLMELFFQHLSQKKRPAEALREAQRQIIASRRQLGSAAHPFFWGAFGFTGR
ncbi:MAG: CHAT domain-containing protein [Prosthecobacter sp.]